jgi:hypothetical protein
MILRLPHPQIGDVSKLFEPELMASCRLILDIEPPQLPALIVHGSHQVKILHLRSHEATKATGLVMALGFHAKDPFLEIPVRLDPQEALA